MTRRASAGFTLVELVMVLVIAGSLAVFALPRALDLTDWRLRAYADSLQAQGRAVQRMALDQRREITGTITGSGVVYAYADGAQVQALACPAASDPCIAEGGSRSVTFNAGNGGATHTSTGAALDLTVGSGDSARRLRIETETGLFRPLP